jgi:hypothetical protein
MSNYPKYDAKMLVQIVREIVEGQPKSAVVPVAVARYRRPSGNYKHGKPKLHSMGEASLDAIVSLSQEFSASLAATGRAGSSGEDEDSRCSCGASGLAATHRA